MMTKTLWCGAMLALLAPSTLAQTTAGSKLPIEVRRDRTVVPVMVGSSGPFRLILDTGMPYDGILLFDTAGVDLTVFDQLARVQIRGAGEGGVSHGLSDADASFSVGGVRFDGQRVTMLTGDAWRDSPFDGVIGYSLLGHYAVEIDYDHNRMILYDPATFTVGEGFASLPISFKENRIPWLDIAVATRGETPVPLAAYIDFASGEAVELLQRPTNEFNPPVLTGDRTKGRGLSGDVPGLRGRVSVVRLGPYVLRDVPVNLVSAVVRSRQPGADAVVGNAVLRRFTVVFDYAHERLHLRPGRAFAEPFR